jgi:hypothetical protein
LFRYPAIQDYPNHLARIFIIRNADDPLLASLYRVAWGWLPNLGWDGLMLLASGLAPIETAGRLSLVLITLLVSAGVAALNRVIAGRWSGIVLLATPLLFSQSFTWGFLAFDMGIGLALFATAFWLALDERQWRFRLLGATVLSTILFVTHLAAWAIYGVILLGLALETLVGERHSRDAFVRSLQRCCRDASQALPALVLFILWLSETAEPSGAATGVEGFQWPWLRIIHVFSIIDAGRPWLTVILVATFIATIGYGLRNGALVLASRMRIPLMLLAALFFCMPDKMSAMSHVSNRVLAGFAIWSMASLRPGPAWAALAPRLYVAVTVVVLAAGFGRLPGWFNTQAKIAAFARLVEEVPEGDRLYVIHAGIAGEDIRADAGGIYHAASYAVPWKKLLVQSMFAYPGQQPIRFCLLADRMRPASAHTVMKDLSAELSRRGASLRDQLADFNHIVVHGPRSAADSQFVPSDLFRLARTEEDFRLYRRRAGAPALRLGSIGDGCKPDGGR